MVGRCFKDQAYRGTASTDHAGLVNGPTRRARFASGTSVEGELRSSASRGQGWIEELLQLFIPAGTRMTGGGGTARRREPLDISWFACSVRPWSRSLLPMHWPRRATNMCRHTRARRPRKRSSTTRRTRRERARGGAAEHVESQERFRCRGSVRLTHRRPPSRQWRRYPPISPPQSRQSDWCAKANRAKRARSRNRLVI